MARFCVWGGSQTDDICVRFSSTPPRPTVDPSRCSVAQVWIYVCVAFGPRRVACYYSGVSVWEDGVHEPPSMCDILN